MRRWLEALKPANVPATVAAGVPVTVSASVSGSATTPNVQ
jgi:D-alanyl-D-alanine endopeptidase (penicillin-binding protein 7)